MTSNINRYSNKKQANNIVGITGGIGSGKTAVTDLLSHKGVPIIDADVISREVVMPDTQGLAAIIKHFGKDILDNQTTLNRAKLRKLIFDDHNKKEILEGILHPIIRKEILEQLNSSSKQNIYTVLSSPLLLETDQYTLTDTIVVIDANESTQVNRASLRDNTPTSQIEKIMNNQMSRKDRCDKADIVINNDSTFDDLKAQVNHLHQQLVKKYSF